MQASVYAADDVPPDDPEAFVDPLPDDDAALEPPPLVAPEALGAGVALGVEPELDSDEVAVEAAPSGFLAPSAFVPEGVSLPAPFEARESVT